MVAEHEKTLVVPASAIAVGNLISDRKIVGIDGPFVCLDLQNGEEYHFLYYSMSFVPNSDNVKLTTDSRLYRD